MLRHCAAQCYKNEKKPALLKKVFKCAATVNIAQVVIMSVCTIVESPQATTLGFEIFVLAGTFIPAQLNLESSHARSFLRNLVYNSCSL